MFQFYVNGVAYEEYKNATNRDLYSIANIGVFDSLYYQGRLIERNDSFIADSGLSSESCLDIHKGKFKKSYMYLQEV